MEIKDSELRRKIQAKGETVSVKTELERSRKDKEKRSPCCSDPRDLSSEEKNYCLRLMRASNHDRIYFRATSPRKITRRRFYGK